LDPLAHREPRHPRLHLLRPLRAAEPIGHQLRHRGRRQGPRRRLADQQRHVPDRPLVLDPDDVRVHHLPLRVHTMKNQTLLLAMVGVLAVSVPPSRPAHAEPRQNTLASDVAVRHRRLLVKRRFEVTPLFESTVNADFRHIIGGGLKIEYHLSDMWSIGAVGVYSTAINTALVNKILPTLEKDVNN